MGNFAYWTTNFVVWVPRTSIVVVAVVSYVPVMPIVDVYSTSEIIILAL